MKFDYGLFCFFNNLAGKTTWLDQSMVMLAKYGHLLFGLVLVWIWFSKMRAGKVDNRRTVLLALAAAAVGLAINQLIGFIYFRPRPFIDHAVTMLINKSPDPSFPSDHSTGAFALALTFLRYDKRLGGAMLIMALLIGFSRVFVGTHYPFDIIGGALTGLTGALITGRQARRLQPILTFILNRRVRR